MQSEARAPGSDEAESIKVGNMEGRSNRGAGRACTGAENKEREKIGREDRGEEWATLDQPDKGWVRVLLSVRDKTTYFKHPFPINLCRHASSLEEGIHKRNRKSNTVKWLKLHISCYVSHKHGLWPWQKVHSAYISACLIQIYIWRCQYNINSIHLAMCDRYELWLCKQAH